MLNSVARVQEVATDQVVARVQRVQSVHSWPRWRWAGTPADRSVSRHGRGPELCTVRAAAAAY